ncbi:MAG: hypothetical protein AB7V46_03545 [Thermomicrobiales bacterium]
MARSGKSSMRPAEQESSPALLFLVGAVVGGLAGAIVGAVLGRHSGDAVSSLAHAVDRKAGRNPKDRPRFELLLQ